MDAKVSKSKKSAPSDKETPRETGEAGRTRLRAARRWMRRLLLLCLLVATAWFAPAIVAHTPLRQRILPTIFPDYPGRIECGAAKLDWLQPAVLSDVTLFGVDGKPLANVGRVDSTKKLWELAANSRQPGHFRIERVRLAIAVQAGGSNVENVVAGWLANADDSSSPLGYSAEIVDGTVDVVEGEEWKSNVARFTLQLSHPFDAQPIKLAAMLAAGELSQAGSIDVSLDWPQFTGDAAGGNGQFTFKARQFALAAINAAAARVATDAEVTGTLDGELTAKIVAAANPECTARGQLTLAGFDFSAPSMFGTDRLRVESARADGALNYQNGVARLDDLKLESGLASVDVNGDFPINKSLAPTLRATVLSLLKNGDYRADGKLNIARLAEVLPKTLRLREGLQMTRGDVSLSLHSRIEDDVRRWNAKLLASNLAARYRGEELTWTQPVRADLVARESSGAIEVEELKCDSDFLQATGKGTLADATLAARCDLNRLSAELNRFVDLSNMSFGGTLSADCRCQRAAGGGERVAMNGTVSVNNFEFVVPRRQPWREKQLVAAFAGDGVPNGAALTSARLTSFQLTSGADRLQIEPLADAGAAEASAAKDLKVRVQGGLETWLARTAPWLGLNDWSAAGQIDAGGNVRVSDGAAEFEKFTADLKNLDLRGGGVFLSDQSARLVTTGRLDWRKRQFTSPVTTWASNSVSARANDVAINYEGANQTIQGLLVFRGGLDDFVRWTHDPRLPRAYRFFGVASGGARISRTEAVTDADWNVEVADLRIVREKPGDVALGANIRRDQPASQQMLAAQTVWQEPKANSAGSVRLDTAGKVTELKQFQLSAGGVGLQLQGQISQAADGPAVNLTGKMNYDLAQTVERFRGFLGEGVTVAGRGERNISLTGPLQPVSQAGVLAGSTDGQRPLVNNSISSASRLSALTGELGFDWTSAQLYGLPVGPGALNARLGSGALDIDPLDLQVGEGRLTIDPRIDLNPAAPRLTMPAGPLVQNLKLTPELCKRWLKYLAPVVADATQCDGHFSVDLKETQVPLLSAGNATPAGLLKIHSADVRPGPMVKPIIDITRQVKALFKHKSPDSSGEADPLMTFPQQDVEFRMVDRRVHHSKLEFVAGDATVRTSGSVGLDQSLDLIAEVPIRDEWVQNDKYLQSLRGQTLKIPIQGTFDRPQVDQRVFAQLSQQLGGAAAGRFLGDQIKKQFDRLFGPK